MFLLLDNEDIVLIIISYFIFFKFLFETYFGTLIANSLYVKYHKVIINANMRGSLISNNIAISNTTAFKKSYVIFSDIYSKNFDVRGFLE